MRLLIAAHSYPPDVSGVAGVVHRHAAGLAARGHEVLVATSAGRDWPAQSVHDGVRVQRFAISGNAAFGFQGAVAAYRSWVAEQDVDVIVLHCTQSWSTDALLLGDRLPVATVLVTHGLGLDDPRYGTYFEQLVPTMRDLAAWVAISPVTEEARYATQVRRTPHIIPNGVDLAEWAPGRGMALRPVASRLINVSNHNPLKGHAVLYDVAQRLSGRIPDLRVDHFGGSYRAARWGVGRFGVRGGCYYSCRQRSARSSAVRWHFSAPRSQMQQALCQADLFVLTSSWEASPLVILEAMAAGKPWVALPAGDVQTRAGGVVVPDAAAMAETVQALSASPARRRELVEAGQEEISRRDWSVVVEQHERLYEQVLREGNAR